MPTSTDGISKVCSHCKLTKPITDFSPDIRSNDGRQYRCRPCGVLVTRKHYLKRKSLVPVLPASGEKTCCLCELIKPIALFNRNRGRKDGLEAYCQACGIQRAALRRTKLQESGKLRDEQDHYNLTRLGISSARYQDLFAAQNGVCAICGKPESTTYRTRTRRLVVDHDHESGVIRGLLCATCNLGIGHLQDSPALLEAAAAYLRQHGK